MICVMFYLGVSAGHDCVYLDLVYLVQESSADRQNAYGKIPGRSASRAPAEIRDPTSSSDDFVANRTGWNTCGDRDETAHRIAEVSMTQTLRHALPHKSGRDHNTSGDGNPCRGALPVRARRQRGR